MIDFADKLRVFIEKLKNRRRKIEAGNTAMLKHMTGVDETCNQKMRRLISQHVAAHTN